MMVAFNLKKRLLNPESIPAPGHPKSLMLLPPNLFLLTLSHLIIRLMPINNPIMIVNFMKGFSDFFLLNLPKLNFQLLNEL